MLVGLKEILEIAEKGNFAIPAFNTYNMESVMGVINAAEKLKAPVIIQCYSRLFDSDNGEYLAEIIKKGAAKTTVPIAYHLDHGAGKKEVLKAIRYGATGIMLDVSTLSFEKNVESTKEIVEYCRYLDIGVEGELGHIGSVNDVEMSGFTDIKEAEIFARETKVDCLAIMVGTAHGKYKKTPKLDIERILKIKEVTNLPLVLHGGSGIPDEEIKMAIKSGIRKINFGTDLCYAFIDGIYETDRLKYALDIFMKKSIEKIQNYAESKIKLLGAENII